VVNKQAVILLFGFILPAQGMSAEVECPEYAQHGSAAEFRFSTAEYLKEIGFPMFHATPGEVEAVSYDTLAGKKGKVVGSTTSPNKIFSYHEVLVEDCTRTFWFDTNGRLEDGDALSGNVEFLTKPALDWRINEKVDPMTDEKSCSVMPVADMPFPIFFYHSSEGFSVGVVGADYPGKATTFRVDKNKAIGEVEGVSGARAQAIASQIRAGGRTLLVSSYTWPREVEVIKEFDLKGLVPQLDACKQSVGTH